MTIICASSENGSNGKKQYELRDGLTLNKGKLLLGPTLPLCHYLLNKFHSFLVERYTGIK